MSTRILVILILVFGFSYMLIPNVPSLVCLAAGGQQVSWVDCENASAPSGDLNGKITAVRSQPESLSMNSMWLILIMAVPLIGLLSLSFWLRARV